MTLGTSLASMPEAGHASSTLPLEMLLHDLSAPLRHVSFFLEQLRDTVLDPTPDQAALVARMTEALAAQRSLLADARLLLSLDRHPTLAWDQPVRVNGVVADVASAFGAELDKHGVRLSVELDEDLPVIVDPMALARVVTNLLGNASKSTPPGGTIRVDAHVEDDVRIFRVTDSGTGFTQDQVARLSRNWDDFDRGLNPPGLWGGLGLLICHSIVVRYGGQLVLTSDGPGKGSTFSFGIRLAAAQAPAVEAGCAAGFAP